MRKYLSVLIILSMIIFSATYVYADEEESSAENNFKIINTGTKDVNISNVTGEVIRVVNQGLFNRIILKTGENTLLAFDIYPFTVVLDINKVQTFLPKQGDYVTVAFDRNRPVAEVYPILRYALAVAAVDPASKTKVCIDLFDDDFKSSGKAFVIDFSDKTTISSLYGYTNIARIALRNSYNIVYYAESSRTYPIKLPAVHIVTTGPSVIPAEERQIAVNKYIESLDENSILVVDKVTYVRLATLSEYLKFNISYNAEDKEASLEKGAETYKIKIGSLDFTRTRANLKFVNEPILHNDRIFVEISFAMKFLYDN